MPFQHTSPDYEFFGSFVEQHIVDFSKFAVYIAHDYDSAQDGIQNALEAILKYYDNVRDFDEQRLFRYCLAVIKHECLRAVANNGKTISVEEVEHFDSIPDEMLDKIIKDEDHATLGRCVEQLPEKFKLAILMKYYYNQSDKIIAESIGVSTGSVRMILTRARLKLKKAYLETSGEEGNE